MVNATPDKRSPPLPLLPLAFLVLSNVVPEVRSGGNTFEAVLAPGRPPFFQCPQVNTHMIYTYPLLTNPQCSNTFTYCAEQVSVPGRCPWGLFFNPRVLSCDHPIPDSCWVDPDDMIQPRPIVDDPSYNDCGRRPCNFFPNGEVEDEGQTYVFCQFGKARVRSCPPGFAFCTKKRDCIPKDEAHVYVMSGVEEGIREVGHPIPIVDEIAPKVSMSTELTVRGKNNPIALEEPGAENTVLQCPGDGAPMSDDSLWSPWYICPNKTFVVTMDPKKITCAAIGIGRDPERIAKATQLTLSKKQRIYFPYSNCDKGNGGVMVGFKMNRAARMPEFFCSNDHAPSGVEFCPATKAICGVSFQNGKDKDVANVRVRCCPVQDPVFYPVEELRFIDTPLNNLQGSDPLNVEFTSTVGIDIPTSPEDKAMRLFYVSLGFTVDHVWDEIERDLRANTSCIRNKEKVPCYYTWTNYTVVNRVGREVKQKISVPPKTKQTLYQVYARAGYFTINTNLYVIKKEKGGKEVPDETTWNGYRPERKVDFSIPPPVYAQNLSLAKVQEEEKKAKEKAATFCKYLNFTAAPNQERQDSTVSIMFNPEGKDEGKWSEFKNCSKKHFVNTLKLGKKGGIANLEMGCRSILRRGLKVIRERRAAPSAKKKKPKPPKVLVLELSGGSPQKLGEEDMSDCYKGAAVGFQVKTSGGVAEDLKLVCSCRGSLLKSKDGYSAPQVCEQLNAISGISARFSDKGMTNFKVRCSHVPAAAAKCKPKWSTRLVATCTTTAVNQSCVFKVPIGVTYNVEKPHLQDSANFMESIGHTLNCAYTPLSRNFKKKYRSDKHWKEDFWYPLTSVVGQIFQLPVGEIELHQVTGKCGPYIVYTSRFVRSRKISKDQEEEEEFTLPLPPGPPVPSCPYRDQAAASKKKNIHDFVTMKKAGPTKMYTIQQVGRNRTFYIQRPPRWDPTPDSVWSKWMWCNNTKPNNQTHVSEIRTDGIFCQPILNPGEKAPPEKTKFHPHNISGLSLNAKDCNKLGGGAIIGFKKQQGQPTEYYCSTSNPTRSAKQEWCPPMTAMCGLSVQYSPSTLKVENLRIKCCKVGGPDWKGGKEGLVHVYTFDNHDKNTWKKFKFLAAFEGAVIHESDKILGQYWQSLGFTWDKVWETVEDAIIYNVTCWDPNDPDCMYPWPEFTFQSEEMTQIQKRILVPPRCILKLYQIYVQVSFYRVYIKRFIELINDTAQNALYEEVRDLQVEIDELDPGLDVQAARALMSGPGPINADNITANDYKEKLNNLNCTFHNYKGKNVEQDPKIEGNGWLSCDEGTWLGIARIQKDSKGRMQDIDIGCKNLNKLTKSGPYIDGDDTDETLVSESSVPKTNYTKKGLVPLGDCANGYFSGFQHMADEFQILCSCKQEDQKRDIWPLSDKIVCDPFYALRAIRPTYFAPGTKDRTLTGLKRFCTKVPSIADSCVPKEVKRKVLVAKCFNDEDIPRECSFKVFVGITYNVHSDYNTNVGNAMEGLGYTIPCTAPVLQKKFQEKLKSPVWREPLWFRLTEMVGRLTNLQPNSETEIYQVMGRCGPYVIHTNKFIQDPEGDSKPDEVLDMPLYDDPDQELCWQDKNYKFPEETDIRQSIITEM